MSFILPSLIEKTKKCLIEKENGFVCFVGSFGWFWLVLLVVLGGFGWFWVVPCFSNYEWYFYIAHDFIFS